MIAAWMGYCTLCALGLGACGFVAERVLIAGRGPVRHVWIAAIMLSVIVPAVALRVAARMSSVDPAVNAARQGTVDSLSNLAGGGAAAIADSTNQLALGVPPRAATNTRRWMSMLSTISAAPRANAALRTLWVVLSAGLAFYLITGIVALALMRRRWARHEIFGTSVFVSERTGPAVVGVVTPSIVLPEWALVMDPLHLELMLRHEVEHQRAGDGRLLVAAQLAAVAMPWNLGVWWLITRLRVALELDCDARVLRAADARAYGDLLLEVARPRRGPGLVGATAFAERATQLERRIRVLARHRVRTSRVARSTAIATGLIAVSVAWVAPHPSVLRGAVVLPAPRILSMSAPDPVAANALPVVVTPPAATRRVASSPRIEATPSAAQLPADVRLATDLAGATARVCVQSQRGQQASTAVDSVFDFLFDGVTLTADAEAKACDILSDLKQAQDTQDQELHATLDAYQLRSNAVRAHRDTLLRALLTNDADRARFDVNAVVPAGGGRGRSGGPPAGIVVGAGGRGTPGERVGGPPGGAGMRGRGGFIGDSIVTMNRVGGRGRGEVAPDSATVAQMQAQVRQLMSELTFKRLFDGITLSPAQESAARAIVTEAQGALTPPPPPRPSLRFNPRMGRVTMRQASADALVALVGSEADQEKVRGRIFALP